MPPLVSFFFSFSSSFAFLTPECGVELLTPRSPFMISGRIFEKSNSTSGRCSSAW